MKRALSELYGELTEDPQRSTLGFSPEISAANDGLFAEGCRPEDQTKIVGSWLHRHQPCLFGRMSAKANLIHFCILSEQDLIQTDEFVRSKIQSARAEWTREGFFGRKSAFIVLAIAKKLAYAEPNAQLMQFASRLCELYLLEEEVRPDEIYVDELFLEYPAGNRATWKWIAGVNVFASAGDRRWWQDHRIPGGLGFSVNSVGHLVHSKLMLDALKSADETLGLSPGDHPTTKVGTLESALEFAMRTIWGASEAVSGKATELLPMPENVDTLPVKKCPAQLPSFLADKNFCEYQGYYHTDITIPSEYFRVDVTRTASIQPRTLDFTYLFNSDVSNPAHQTMGRGRRIRGDEGSSTISKDERSNPKILSVDDCINLREALNAKRTRG